MRRLVDMCTRWLVVAVAMAVMVMTLVTVPVSIFDGDCDGDEDADMLQWCVQSVVVVTLLMLMTWKRRGDGR